MIFFKNRPVPAVGKQKENDEVEIVKTIRIDGVDFTSYSVEILTDYDNRTIKHEHGYLRSDARGDRIDVEDGSAADA